MVCYYAFFLFCFFYFGILFHLNDYVVFLEWELFSMNSVVIFYVLMFDWVCLIFISIVMFISSMVIFYSIQYMGCISYSSLRFVFLVVLFVFSMFLMIVSPYLLSILLGWDGLGLVSYCLVIYYSSIISYLAGLVTCLINRLGDIGLIVSVSWMMSYGS